MTEEPVAALDEPGRSILREGEAAIFLRSRIERPSRWGFYGLAAFGAATVGVSATLWILAHTTLALALSIFGGVLIILGYIQNRLYRRDTAHWPDQAILWDGGIELVLHNGEIRGVSWTDPDLALNLVARRAPAPAVREFLLVWMTEGKIPSVELTEEGFEAIQRSAVAHQLTILQRRAGRRTDATQTVEIRQGEARKLAAPSRQPKDKPAPGAAEAE